jgi:hypothetical protein
MVCLTPQYQIYIVVSTSISNACLFPNQIDFALALALALALAVIPSARSHQPRHTPASTHPSQSPLLCHMHIRRAVPHRSPSTSHESMNLLHHAARLRPTPKSMENSKSIKNKSRSAKVALAKINQSQYSCILPAFLHVHVCKL